MNRADWEAWRRAKGEAKRALLTKLLKDNDALAHYYVRFFEKSTNYYTGRSRDDLLQAARIGIIQALPKWRPRKGGFSAVAFRWALHEMQMVIRHDAMALSIPKSAHLSRATQDEAVRFYAVHGREPEPEEIGVSRIAVDRARKASVTFVSPAEAEEVVHDAPSPEEMIDRKRDQEALRVFLATLSKKDRAEFWTGKREDLTAKAKAFVEGKRK